MTQAAFSQEEIAQHGRELYQKYLSGKVETANNIGKMALLIANMK